jgi:phenylacetic acid degradation operon negative regulatory protein
MCNVNEFYQMPANPRRLILNLLLGAGGEPLAARDAVASCALFAISENSARVALARLAAGGLIEAGGRGAYRLGPSAADLAADVGTWRTAERRVCDWSGRWIAVHVGGLGRGNRVALRRRERAFRLLGLGEVDRGLHLRPDNLVGGVAAARERLVKLGVEATAAVFVAADFDPDRERRARALWDGSALTRLYRANSRRLGAWLARCGTLTPEVAARESFLLGNEAIRDLVFDPLLPAPLVDVEARHAFVDALLRFDAAGHSIWKRFLDTARSRHPGTRTRSALARPQEATE